MYISALFDIRFPLIQAPMAGVQDADLAIAVCEAGGLGSLPCAMLTPEAVLTECSRIRARTDRPFNLNFFCHRPPGVNEAALAVWKTRFAGYYDAWDIDPQAVGPGAIRQPFGDAMATVVEQVRPAVVSFHFGLPDAALVERVRRSGAKILSSATTVAEAQWLEENGVDAIIAQGLEAGGHRGVFLGTGGGIPSCGDAGLTGGGEGFDLSTQTGTFALLPQIVRAVRVPVVAAGGIADAAGVGAAFRLGAAGVQVGTAYLLCNETKTSAVHRAALCGEGARHTALTNVFTGRPARGIVNRLMLDLGSMCPDAPPFPMATAASAPLRAKAEAAGCGDFSPLWAGQNTTGCKAVPAGELTRQLMAGLDMPA